MAQHYLTIPDPGPEGKLHSCRFRAKLEFRAPELGEYDYPVDIGDYDYPVDIGDATVALEAPADRYTDATSDDLPEFDGDNPGVEWFSRVVFDPVTDRVTDDTVAEPAVTVRADDEAVAGYTAAA